MGVSTPLILEAIGTSAEVFMLYYFRNALCLWSVFIVALTCFFLVETWPLTLTIIFPH